MAQAAAITLADGQATPVNITFNPESVTPDSSIFVDRSSGVAAFFRRLTVRYSPASGTRKTVRTSYDVSVPVTATVDGVSTVVRTLRAKVDVILPDGSTDAERKDLYAFLKNGLANALIQGNLRDHDPLY